MSQPDFHLTAGSKYIVTSLAGRDSTIKTHGIFRGFAAVGSGDGLVFEMLDGELKGKLRVIPSHMILAIDVLEPVPAAPAKERDEEMDRHYL